MHPAVEPLIEPKDTKRVNAMIGNPIAVAINPDSGDNINKAAHPEAIPLPPLKFMYIGQLCPHIIAIPAYACIKLSISIT